MPRNSIHGSRRYATKSKSWGRSRARVKREAWPPPTMRTIRMFVFDPALARWRTHGWTDTHLSWLSKSPFTKYRPPRPQNPIADPGLSKNDVTLSRGLLSTPCPKRRAQTRTRIDCLILCETVFCIAIHVSHRTPALTSLRHPLVRRPHSRL